MNKIYLILVLILLFSCVREKGFIHHKYEINQISEIYDNNIEEISEIYRSNINDTLYNQNWIIRNGVLDTLSSNFYILDLERIEDEKRNLGTLTINSPTYEKHKASSIEREIWLHLIQFKDSKIDILDYHSINSNKVDFDFYSDNDTIVGVLREQILKDTIVDGEKMIRFIEVILMIDNKHNTNNPFIETFREED